MRNDFLIFGSPLIGEEEVAEVVATLRSGWLSTGPRTHQLEEDFKRYVRCKHSMAVSSCTAGLHLALDVAGIVPGDLVITTPMTFAATANVIVQRGARPIFLDVDRRTMNLDPNRVLDVARKLTSGRQSASSGRLRAIIPVHMAGRPCDMNAIMEIARSHDLLVIEDAAHAIESWYRDRKIGTIGDITAFSFYVTKNVCTGEGGMVTTERDDWAEEIRVKSLHGISKDAWRRYSSAGFQPYETIYPGYKYNMMDLQAALGIHQLARVEENLGVRERHWQHYDRAFADLPEVMTPLDEANIRHARHLYTILLDLDRLSCSREEVVAALKAENVGTGIHFTALHLHRYYRETFGYRRGDLPNAEWIGDRTISLPLSAKLTDQDVEDVILAVRKVVEEYRR
ncbi:MAG: DegT/DnrJ/EryC1/StrS aminotransferase family protein [Chloroflexota bacterium]|nr:MAG: DegT/DnrJ/EryC1/StrS aminotransferase family protein [Chloroflexota bacterium]